jgi:hypothetical protein
VKENNVVVDGVVYYHLFESRKGKHKCEIVSSNADWNAKLQNSAKGFTTYQNTIYRWLNGRYDPVIPRYSEIPEDETAAALRGAISKL